MSIDTGSEIVLRKDVVLVAPFNPADNPEIRPKGERRSRVVLLNRSFLAPKPPEHFMEAYGFTLLERDRIAPNPDHIGHTPDILHVRRYERNPVPGKNYQTEIFWEGGYTAAETEPQIVFDILHPKEPGSAAEREASSSNRPPPRRRASRASRDEPAPRS